MTKETISTLVHARFRETSKHFRRLKKQAAVDPVHDFRVAVKKLRAILRLISMDQFQQIKIPAHLKQIYRSAGIIREMQVLEFRHEQSGMLTVFTKSQVRNKKKKELGKLRRLVSDHGLNKDEHELLPLLPEKLSYRTILHFFNSKVDEIKNLVNLKRITDEVMHQVRKLIKDLLYCAQLLENETSFRFPYSVWNTNKEKYYSQLAGELGEYHDRSVEITLMPELKKTSGMVKYKKQLLQSLRKNIDETDPQVLFFEPVFKPGKNLKKI